jgi:hypothetical protein
MRRSPLLLTLALLFASCQATRPVDESDLLVEWDHLEQEEQSAQSGVREAELRAQEAVESPDPADDLPAAEQLAQANQALNSVEARFADLERRILERRGLKIAGPLNALYPGIGALVMAAVPLVGKRGRKLYGSALRNTSKGQLMVAAGDILKALGASHSSPQDPPKA